MPKRSTMILRGDAEHVREKIKNVKGIPPEFIDPVLKVINNAIETFDKVKEKAEKEKFDVTKFEEMYIKSLDEGYLLLRYIDQDIDKYIIDKAQFNVSKVMELKETIKPRYFPFGSPSEVKGQGEKIRQAIMNIIEALKNDPEPDTEGKLLEMSKRILDKLSPIFSTMKKEESEAQKEEIAYREAVWNLERDYQACKDGMMFILRHFERVDEMDTFFPDLPRNRMSRGKGETEETEINESPETGTENKNN